jgi:hypothetical protein
VQRGLQILQLTTGQIVYHRHGGLRGDKGVHDMTADERRASGD